jgi:predicted RNA-binding Zn-ribbon protein involved in translation (DUF1610 family)
MNDELPVRDDSVNSFDLQPPEGSTIEILEESVERLVLFMPATRKRGWELGCFGLIWTTIVSIITAAMVHGLRQPGGPEPVALLFLVPFWLVGLLILFISLKMRHTRTLVLIEPGRAVLQTTFFGRTKTRETALTAGEPATLVESYRQNDVPVDAVCLKGASGPLKFGTPLEASEKTWIVDRINAFLGVTVAGHGDDPLTGLMPTWVAPVRCSSCGSDLSTVETVGEEAVCPFCGEVTKAEMRLVRTGPSDTQSPAGEFPADRVAIVEQTPDVLEFRMPVFESKGMRRGAATALGLFAVFWNSIVGVFVWGAVFGARFNAGTLFLLVFLIPFVAVGLAVVVVAVFIAAGRLKVTLDRDRLRASWGVGPIRYRKSFPTETITHVTVENSPMAVKSQRPRSQTEDTRMALVWAGERWIPITMLQGVNDCRHVAELVRRQLAQMGFRVSDRRIPAIQPSGTDELDEDEDEDDDVVEEGEQPGGRRISPLDELE